jgi:sugar phosphate isomerase/epimerase
MELKIFKTLWGHTGSFAAACEDAVKAEFDGIEGPSPSAKGLRSDYRKMLNDHGLEYIAEITTGGSYVPDAGLDPAAHFASFQRKLEHCLELNPRFINCLAGNDLWSFSDTVRLLQKLIELGEENDVTVAFETHRSRSTFHPLITAKLLGEIPELQLTLDFSHWCCVCERLVLDELPQVLELCAQRAKHIHARVGYDQGPQVPDPRAPEYSHALAAHEMWWNYVWEEMQRRGFFTTTMTPEFGPDGYLHLQPFTQQPVADLWEINTWIGQREKARFREWKQSTILST